MLADIHYNRVLPRDLFNESKLLKCIGRLCLLIHDNMIPFSMSVEENDEPFEIGLLEDGHLTITNLNIFIMEQLTTFKTVYNSKLSYPLIASYGYDECVVFDNDGQFTEEFIKFNEIIES